MDEAGWCREVGLIAKGYEGTVANLSEGVATGGPMSDQ